MSFCFLKVWVYVAIFGVLANCAEFSNTFGQKIQNAEEKSDIGNTESDIGSEPYQKINVYPFLINSQLENQDSEAAETNEDDNLPDVKKERKFRYTSKPYSTVSTSSSKTPWARVRHHGVGKPNKQKRLTFKDILETRQERKRSNDGGEAVETGGIESQRRRKNRLQYQQIDRQRGELKGQASSFISIKYPHQLISEKNKVSYNDGQDEETKTEQSGIENNPTENQAKNYDYGNNVMADDYATGRKEIIIPVTTFTEDRLRKPKNTYQSELPSTAERHHGSVKTNDGAVTTNSQELRLDEQRYRGINDEESELKAPTTNDRFHSPVNSRLKVLENIFDSTKTIIKKAELRHYKLGMKVPREGHSIMKKEIPKDNIISSQENKPPTTITKGFPSLIISSGPIVFDNPHPYIWNSRHSIQPARTHDALEVVAPPRIPAGPTPPSQNPESRQVEEYSQKPTEEYGDVPEFKENSVPQTVPKQDKIGTPYQFQEEIRTRNRPPNQLNFGSTKLHSPPAEKFTQDDSTPRATGYINFADNPEDQNHVNDLSSYSSTLPSFDSYSLHVREDLLNKKDVEDFVSTLNDPEVTVVHLPFSNQVRTDQPEDNVDDQITGASSYQSLASDNDVAKGNPFVDIYRGDIYNPGKTSIWPFRRDKYQQMPIGVEALGQETSETIKVSGMAHDDSQKDLDAPDISQPSYQEGASEEETERLPEEGLPEMMISKENQFQEVIPKDQNLEHQVPTKSTFNGEEIYPRGTASQDTPRVNGHSGYSQPIATHGIDIPHEVNNANENPNNHVRTPHPPSQPIFNHEHVQEHHPMPQNTHMHNNHPEFKTVEGSSPRDPIIQNSHSEIKDPGFKEGPVSSFPGKPTNQNNHAHHNPEYKFEYDFNTPFHHHEDFDHSSHFPNQPSIHSHPRPRPRYSYSQIKGLNLLPHPHNFPPPPFPSHNTIPHRPRGRHSIMRPPPRHPKRSKRMRGRESVVHIHSIPPNLGLPSFLHLPPSQPQSNRYSGQHSRPIPSVVPPIKRGTSNSRHSSKSYRKASSEFEKLPLDKPKHLPWPFFTKELPEPEMSYASSGRSMHRVPFPNSPRFDPRDRPRLMRFNRGAKTGFRVKASSVKRKRRPFAKENIRFLASNGLFKDKPFPDTHMGVPRVPTRIHEGRRPPKEHFNKVKDRTPTESNMKSHFAVFQQNEKPIPDFGRVRPEPPNIFKGVLLNGKHDNQINFSSEKKQITKNIPIIPTLESTRNQGEILEAKSVTRTPNQSYRPELSLIDPIRTSESVLNEVTMLPSGVESRSDTLDNHITTEEASQPLPKEIYSKKRMPESHRSLLNNLKYGVNGEPLDVWIPMDPIIER